MRPTIIVTNRAHLDQLIAQEMKTQGPSCDLNHLDISAMTDLSSLFAKFPTFQGDVSRWNTSNVTNMSYLFANTAFTGDISQWNVSKVQNMSHLFYLSSFSGDVSNWDVSNVTDMNAMFNGVPFNGVDVVESSLQWGCREMEYFERD